MNRYPAWLNALVVLALVVAVLYTLPNFYGEAPAVQVSPTQSTRQADEALRARVAGVLQDGHIQNAGVELDGNTVKFRVEDTDIQLKAKDLLQSQLGESYTVALNLVPRSPRWLTAMHALPMYLGLDLRGGVHFLLQVDMKAVLEKKLDGLGDFMRNSLRDKRVGYAGITREGQTLTVRFRDAATRDQALDVLSGVTELQAVAADDSGQPVVKATLRPEEIKRAQDLALQQNITTLRNRVNELGVAEPLIQQQGADRIVVQLPGVQDSTHARQILGRTATLEVHMVEAQGSNPAGRDYDPQKVDAAVKGNVPFDMMLFHNQRDPGNEPLLIGKTVLLTGERFTSAQPGFDSQNQQPNVNVELDGQGARIMADTTRDAIKRRMAIILVEKGEPDLVTAPVIQSELGARFQITGSKSAREANDLALLIRAGALAAPMDIVEERTVGPSLGADNIKVGFHSTWIGFSLISVFMILYYATFGVFSIIALACNVLFLVALLSMLQATLTLPGMAGIALTVGMAIDANVLINERIREELRNGTTPQAAIAAGYDRAWGTIFDSNITTLIAGMALFAFGSGPVKGFAVVLCLGILTSIFSSVVVSRALVNAYFGRRRRLERVSIGQVWRGGAPAGNARAKAKG